jgi:hypothetical protein
LRNGTGCFVAETSFEVSATTETAMSVKLQIIKNKKAIFEDRYEISDAESFGRAFSDVWSKLRQAQFDKETSIGALMDHLDDDGLLDQLNGASIRLERT